MNLWDKGMARIYVHELSSFGPPNLQSFTKYLRLTLVFMWNSALREKFIFCFQGFLVGINGMLILAGGLGYHSIEFRHFPDIS